MTQSTNPHPPSTGSRTLALFGATRGVGRCVLRRALADGHTVRALVRDAGRLDRAVRDLPEAAKARLVPVFGDVLHDEAVKKTLEGAGAVLCALGASARNHDQIRTRGTAALVRGMKATGIDRIVAVTVLGAHESRDPLPWWLRNVVFPLFLAPAIADHEGQEEVLRASGLRWTAVRPTNLTDGPATNAYAAGNLDFSTVKMTVSRQDVAAFMLDVIERDAFVTETPAICDRKARYRSSERPHSPSRSGPGRLGPS